MLRLLKSNNPVNYIVAFMLMLALWAYRFIAMPPTISVGAMNSYFFPVLFDGTFIQYLLASAAFILTFAFASYLAKANFKYQIVGSGYQIPTIFFVILSGMLITAQSFIPEQIASFLVAFSILQIFGTYNKAEAIPQCLNAGYLLGLAVVFAYKYIFLFPIVLIIIKIVKATTWRDIASFIIAFLFVPAIFVCLVWLYGDWNEMTNSISDELTKLIFGEKYNLTNYLTMVPVVVSALAIVASYFGMNVSRKTSEMKFYTSLVFLSFAEIAFLFSPLASNESVWLLIFPLSYLLSGVIINIKKNWLQKMLFYGIFLTIILSQVIQIMYFNSIF